MAYLIASRVLLFHTPKTAGSFIFDILKEYIREIGHVHDTPDMIDWEAFSCSFVRDPIKWWESYWNWKNKDWDHPEGRHLHYQPTKHLFEYKSNNIERFIKNVYRKEPGFITKIFDKYTRVDKVYRYEDLFESIVDICWRANLDIDIPSIKKYHRVNPGHRNDRIKDKSVIELIKSQEIEIYQKYY